ncbi:MAG: deoxyribodipyrimidine photo-lyase [Microcystaceae cyanobacterium]
MLILFWHRRDLRISDNIGLENAYQKTSKIVGLFCFDSAILTKDDIAPVRVKYLLESLKYLQQSYQKLGSNLLILQGKPEQVIPQLADQIKGEVFWNLDVEPYAKERDQSVINALEEKEISYQTFWDQLLHSPGEIKTKTSDEPYKVYTPFWKNWSQKTKAAIAKTPLKLEGLTKQQLEQAKTCQLISLPTLEKLGFSCDIPLLIDAGEKAAKEQLDQFVKSAIYNYQEQRNFPEIDGTSRLSPALKFGTIGIRTLWQATLNALENSRSDEVTNNIKTWHQELAWREFYQHCLYFFPELAEGPYRAEFNNFIWDNNEAYFRAWCEGKTGYPIVDAAMRQLNETGWMHNRCRMIVASFLTKDLIINWQWGEKYFMQHLIDGDLASNNGGWQWSASSGMDPKPLRIFNPASQAQKFDPEAEYIRRWLPELSSLDTEYLVTGKIPSLDCHQCGYPQPIVDHKIQQREFKQRYKAIKS